MTSPYRTLWAAAFNSSKIGKNPSKRLLGTRAITKPSFSLPRSFCFSSCRSTVYEYVEAALSKFEQRPVLAGTPADLGDALHRVARKGSR
jgi:hypothetical protein